MCRAAVDVGGDDSGQAQVVPGGGGAGGGAATSRLAAAPCARGRRGPPGAGEIQEPGAQEVAEVLVVVQVEQQGGQVEGAVTGQDGRVDVDHAGDRGAVGQQVGRGEVVMDEVLAGRDGRHRSGHRSGAAPEAGHGRRAGLQGGVQAVPVAAAGQRPGEQARPSAGAGAQARLGVVQPSSSGSSQVCAARSGSPRPRSRMSPGMRC